LSTLNQVGGRLSLENALVSVKALATQRDVARRCALNLRQCGVSSGNLQSA
jgi:hypothetical protein